MRPMPLALLLALFAACPLFAEQSPAPDDPLTLSQRAGAAYAAGNFKEAGELYARVMQRLPRNVSIRVAYARTLARQQRNDDALRELEAASAFGLAFNAEDPAWHGVAAGARFREIVSKMRARSAPIVRSETAFLLEKDLIPESVAFDPQSGSFFVGSMYKRKILKIAADATISDFVAPGRDGLFGVVGMKVDAERGELWANSCNSDRPPMQRREPETAGESASSATTSGPAS